MARAGTCACSLNIGCYLGKSGVIFCAEELLILVAATAFAVAENVPLNLHIAGNCLFSSAGFINSHARTERIILNLRYFAFRYLIIIDEFLTDLGTCSLCTVIGSNRLAEGINGYGCRVVRG